MVDFAEKVISTADFSPAPIFCIDICETLEKELKMVEIGGINCAGLYMCDMEKIVIAANEIAVKEWKEVYL